jgi:hypothetical protein
MSLGVDIRTAGWRGIVSVYDGAMAQTTITTDRYKLFPSPRNVHRVVFEL